MLPTSALILSSDEHMRTRRISVGHVVATYSYDNERGSGYIVIECLELKAGGTQVEALIP